MGKNGQLKHYSTPLQYLAIWQMSVCVFDSLCLVFVNRLMRSQCRSLHIAKKVENTCHLWQQPLINMYLSVHLQEGVYLPSSFSRTSFVEISPYSQLLSAETNKTCDTNHDNRETHREPRQHAGRHTGNHDNRETHREPQQQGYTQETTTTRRHTGNHDNRETHRKPRQQGDT